MRRKHAIITLSDANCGDFALEHWYASLSANVTLDDIDVIILDYGLTDRQRDRLEEVGVECWPCHRDGWVGTLLWRDMAALLEQRDYDQVLTTDAGDMIFQTDIRPLFDENKDAYRAVCEDFDTSIHDLVMSRKDFSPQRWEQLSEALRGKPVINGAVIFAPAEKFKKIWPIFQEWCQSFDQYASDQFLVNYIIYEDRFVRLDSRYNFVFVSTTVPHSVREGVFYDGDGEIIPIVHNAGGKESYRFYRNFGYGKSCNQKKWFTPLAVRAYCRAAQWYKKIVQSRRKP
jgi:hypothetical protein